MDFPTLMAAVVLIATAMGGWVQGRKAGLGSALTTASDVVGMLATQVGELRTQLSVKDAQIERLEKRIATMEGHPPSDE